jgi:hypothetical protein
MKEVLHTKLNYVFSKDFDKIFMWVNSLPYKIEIKGNAVHDGKNWYLFFIQPDDAKPIISELD